MPFKGVEDVGRDAMLYMREGVAATWGFCQIYSSIRSLMKQLGMLQGVNCPLGSMIFPSAFFLQLPSLIYDWQTKQLLMKCPASPQKMQTKFLICLGRSVVVDQGALVGFKPAKVVTRVATNFSRIAKRSSDLI